MPTALLVLLIVIPLATLIWRAIMDPAFWPSIQTMPLTNMAALESDLSAALALAVLLVVLAAIVLITSRLLAHHWIDH